MGFRFRKSIKIAPGVSSVSVGSFNFGKRGVYNNFNIPGTGISYRSRIAGESQNKSTASKSRRPKTTQQMPATLKLQDDGSVIFTDKKDNPLSDNLIREAKKQNREIILNWLQEHCEKYNTEVETFLNIHLTTPAPLGEIIVNPKPEPPKMETYGFASKLFDSRRQKVDERNKRAQQEYETTILEWEKAEHALRTDTEVMSTILSSAFACIEWPRETLVSFDVIDEGHTVLLDVDLPEIEDMPTKEAKVNSKNLRLIVKDRSQSQRQLEYLTHIHAIGFRFIGDVFAYLPSISTVVFSGYSQRIDTKTGNTEDEYLYSVRVPREMWEQINFDNLETVDVVPCFERFELRRKVTKRGIISPVEPFER